MTPISSNENTDNKQAETDKTGEDDIIDIDDYSEEEEQILAIILSYKGGEVEAEDEARDEKSSDLYGLRSVVKHQYFRNIFLLTKIKLNTITIGMPEENSTNVQSRR